MNETPRVWVGCLACYNAGRLLGDWFDAIDAPTDMDVFDERTVHEHDDPYSHEELWVFDHEGFGSLLKGECSPFDAQRIAEWMNLVEEEGHDLDAVMAYAEAFSITPGPDLVLDDFSEAFCGEYDDREDYAYHLADDLGLVPEGNAWPASYIDWERAARDLFMDYADAPAPGGGIYVFRCL